MSKRHLIGLLTNDLVGSYQYSFWSGMKDAARDEDCDLVSFNGGELGSGDASKSMRNSTFENVKQVMPDALVMLSPVVANSNRYGLIDSLLGSLGSIPLITVGIEIPGHSAMSVNNVSGMDELVEHLFAVHDRKKFAFVGGPSQNPESSQRREAFLRALARHEIPLEPAFDLEGEFDFGIAKRKVAALLHSGGEFDALVAANDEMALGAMEAIKEFGRHIPGDVVVTGFDDIEEARYARPSLTTVRHPVFEQGRASIPMALDRIEGLKVQEEHRLATSMVARGSCGCHSASMLEAGSGRSKVVARTDLGGALGGADHIRSVIEHCAPSLGGPRFALQLEELVAVLSSECIEGRCGKGQRLFEYLIGSASTSNDDSDRWQTFLSRLRSASIPFFPANPVAIVAFEDVIHQMRVFIHERTTQNIMVQSLKERRWSRDVHQTACRMLENFEFEHLVEVMAKDARHLQISTLQFLVREPGLSEGDFRLALSMVRGTRIPLPRFGTVLSFGSAWRSIVHNAPVRSSVVIEPLFFNGEQLGFLLLELVARRGMLLDSLSGQISATMAGSRFLESVSDGSVHGKSHPGSTNDGPIMG